jgi:hypothetical protein
MAMKQAMELTKAGTSRKRPPRLGEGAPSTYSEAAATQICTRLMQGESLVSICRDNAMPSYATVMYWLDEKHPNFHSEFLERYAHARERQAEYFGDETKEIADNCAETPEAINKARLRIDQRKWFASKLAPKKYGDKSEVNVNQTFDVADRIVARWKENLAKLNADDGVIEGEVVEKP